MGEQDCEQLPQLPFTIGEFQFIDILGSGGFSNVYKVLHLSSGQYFAAKSCKIKHNDAKKRNVTLAEMNSLKDLYHPNIIKIYDIVEGFGFIFMILEYMSGGNMKSIVQKSHGLRPKALASAIYQILTAVEFCHSKNIAHHDIKPENFLIDNNERCVLSDFGLSCILQKNCKINDFSGSLPFKAPEILQRKEHDPFKADIWALGVSFYFLATGMLPWGNDISIKSTILNGFYTFPPGFPYNLQCLIRAAMTYDPLKRPTAAELLSMPYFQQNIERVPIVYNETSRASITLRHVKNICVPRPKRLSKKSVSLSAFRHISAPSKPPTDFDGIRSVEVTKLSSQMSYLFY